ncbi:MAG: hypothetical protein AAF609_22295, partial [Cyanobacteria bacterium P01_C01_bin.120]
MPTATSTSRSWRTIPNQLGEPSAKPMLRREFDEQKWGRKKLRLDLTNTPSAMNTTLSEVSRLDVSQVFWEVDDF